MFPEYIAVALQQLRANPLRSLLSTLGVIIGVGSLVSILALVDGMEAFARADIASTTDLQIITVSSVTTDRVEDVVVRRRGYPVFTPDDARLLQARLGDAAQVGLIASYSTHWSTAQDTAGRAAVVSAVTPAMFAMRGANIAAGRLLQEADYGQALTVLSAGAAAEFAGDAAAAVGRSINVAGTSFDVVGVVELPEEGSIARIAVPLAPQDQLPGLDSERPPQFVVRAARVEEVPQVRAQTENWLAERWDTAGRAFSVSSNVERVAQASRAMLVFRLVLGTIAGISLVVGGIGIMNVLLASVTERTREIGIRRAAGARQRDIRRQFLAEAVTISAVGSGLGALLGMLVSAVALQVVSRMAEAQIRAVFAWESLLFAMAAAVIVGLVFGTYPAVRAGRMSPIEALRHE